MKLLNNVVDAIVKTVMALSSCTVFLLTFAQVVCRYVLKSPLPWSTDILRLAFTYLVFWGAAWCAKTKGHLNVDVVLTAMPAKLRKVVELLINVVLCGLYIFLAVYGYQFAMGGMSQTTSYLPLPMTFYYASIPTASVIMLFYTVQIIVEQIKTFNKEEEKA